MVLHVILRRGIAHPKRFGPTQRSRSRHGPQHPPCRHLCNSFVIHRNRLWLARTQGRCQLFRASAEQDNEEEQTPPSPPSPQTSPVPTSLESWEGVEAPAPQEGGALDWVIEEPKLRPARQPAWLSNAVLVGAVSAAACLAFITQRYYSAVNSKRTAEGKLPSIAVSVGPRQSAEERQNQLRADRESATSTVIAPLPHDDATAHEEKKEHGEAASPTFAFTPTTGAESDSTESHTVKLRPGQVAIDIGAGFGLTQPPTEETPSSAETTARNEVFDAATQPPLGLNATPSTDGAHGGSASPSQSVPKPGVRPRAIEGSSTARDGERGNVEEESTKLPLRTPQGAAAMERIRKLQARRQQLYQRALDRHEALDAQQNKQKQLDQQRRREDEAKEADVARGLHPRHRPPDNRAFKEENTRLHDGSTEVATATASSAEGNGASDSFAADSPTLHTPASRDRDVVALDVEAIREAARRLIAEEHEQARPPRRPEEQVGEEAITDDAQQRRANPDDVPKGTTLAALRDRARIAQKSAAGAATAAHRAMGAAALAAEAADAAVHRAQLAALSAAKCQSALERRSADAVEAAVKATVAAESAAAVAAQRASVGAAKAVVQEHDAQHLAQGAIEAGELSSPHGVVEKVTFALGNARKGVLHAVGAVKGSAMAVGKGASAAGKEVQSSVAAFWNRVAEKLKW